MPLTNAPRPSKPKAVRGKKTVKPKAGSTTARLFKDEQKRRENAAARIREAAEAAGTQKARIGIFMARLRARIERATERIEKLVADERGRQARMLEKHPELKQLNGQPSLDDAAKIPDVEIPEKELPAYITNIQPNETE